MSGTSSSSVLTECLQPNMALAPSDAKPTRLSLYGILFLLKNLIITSKILFAVAWLIGSKQANSFLTKNRFLSIILTTMAKCLIADRSVNKYGKITILHSGNQIFK